MLRRINNMLQQIAFFISVVAFLALVACVLFGDFQTGADFIGACMR